MNRKLFLPIFLLLFIVVVYFSVSKFSHHPVHDSIPATSLEEAICTKVEEKQVTCQKVMLIDTDSNVAFVETEFGILPVLISKDQTEVVKLMNGVDFQEFREEKEESGPISWRIENNVQKDFSIMYGFARDNAKTILIKSEGNLQPNKFFVREDSAGMSSGPGTAPLWFWYITSKQEMSKPADLTVYGADDEIIYGGNNENH